MYVEPTSLSLALFLSLSVAVMAGCAQAKVRRGMLSASETCPGATEIPLCLGRSSFTLKEKGHKLRHALMLKRLLLLLLLVYVKNMKHTHKNSLHIDVENEICTYLINVFVFLNHSASA